MTTEDETEDARLARLMAEKTAAKLDDHTRGLNVGKMGLVVPDGDYTSEFWCGYWEGLTYSQRADALAWKADYEKLRTNYDALEAERYMANGRLARSQTTITRLNQLLHEAQQLTAKNEYLVRPSGTPLWQIGHPGVMTPPQDENEGRERLRLAWIDREHALICFDDDTPEVEALPE